VFFAISWKSDTPSGTQRSYQEHELDALRAQAQFLRSGGGGAGLTNPDSFAERLRTLGQEFDDAGIEMTAILQVPEGFRVSGIADGVYRTQLCFFSELEEASEAHRSKRGSGGGRRPEDIDPYLAVTVGAAVFTRDNQRLGKVADLQARSIKVGTPLLQSDFWLPAACISSATRGESVLLSIAKDELPKFRRKVPPRERK
jgi:hypothetical protein